MCYAFPPYPGIGGRRWAKFAAELYKRGHNVHVIASQNPFPSTSIWTEETQHIPQTRLPLNYPSALILFPKGILGKINYNISLILVKLLSKGNYFDRTIFWEKALKTEIRKRIKAEGLNNVVISGAPFYMLKIGSELKKEFPDTTFIADLRDPWTSNQSAYGFGTISKKRLLLEREWEKGVFAHFDKVISVNNAMTRYFQSIYGNGTEKFLTIPNGYDPAEVALIEETDIRFDSNNLNLVFAGSFYENAIYLYDNLIDALKRLLELQPRIHFYFYGPNFDRLKSRTPKEVEKYFSFGWVDSIAKTNALIKAADLAMLFLTDDINNSFSTKFCEYIKFRKPIVLFAKTGETSDFIVQSKLGFTISPGTEFNAIQELLRVGKGFQFPPDFNETEYAIPALTDQLERLLK